MNLEGRKVKVFQLAVGVDLIGSKMSMAASKNVELILLDHGIAMHSKTSNRTIVITFNNIKGYELFPESQTAETPAPTRGRPKAIQATI